MDIHDPQIHGAIGAAAETPSILLLPGLDNSGPGHWQTHWERLSFFSRIEFPGWASPRLDTWVPTLDCTIRAHPRPLILVGHSLGSLAAVWWAAQHWLESLREKVVGALLVAPPDVDALSVNARIRDFRPIPKLRLPFRSIVVASRNDPYATIERTERMARFWGSDFVDAGRRGHLNARSALGEWTTGLELVARLGGRSANLLAAELGLRFLVD